MIKKNTPLWIEFKIL